RPPGYRRRARHEGDHGGSVSRRASTGRRPAWLSSAFRNGRNATLSRFTITPRKRSERIRPTPTTLGWSGPDRELSRTGRAVDEIAPGVRRFRFQAHTVFYTPTRRKSGKSPCESPGGPLSSLHD